MDASSRVPTNGEDADVCAGGILNALDDGSLTANERACLCGRNEQACRDMTLEALIGPGDRDVLLRASLHGSPVHPQHGFHCRRYFQSGLVLGTDENLLTATAGGSTVDISPWSSCALETCVVGGILRPLFLLATMTESGEQETLREVKPHGTFLNVGQQVHNRHSQRVPQSRAAGPRSSLGPWSRHRSASRIPPFAR